MPADVPGPSEPASTADTSTLTGGSFLRRLLRLYGYASRYAGRLTVALTALVAASALGLVFPKYFGVAIDAAFTKGNLGQLDATALTLVAIFAAQAVFVFIRHWLMSWVGERVVADLRRDLQRHLVSLPQSFFHRTRTGEILSRLSDDVSRLQQVVSEDLSVFLRNLLTLVGGIAILFWINPTLTAVMLAVVPPLVVAASVWGRRVQRLSKAAQQRLAEAAGTLQEGLGAIETVQAFTREEHEAARYGKSIDEAFGFFVKLITARSWFMAVATFLAFSTIAGIFWLGGRMVVSGAITPGQLAEFFFYTMAVAGAVGALSGLYGSYQAAIGATERVFEILDEMPDVRDPARPVSLGRARGHICFEDVHFGYGDRAGEVIRGVTLEVRPGEVCALVGASGSGKTTLGRLVLRFWDPTSGRITLDGHGLPDLALAELRGSIGLVSQEPVLFSGTIRENIRYGRLIATDAEVEYAARAANADTFVREFPQGYETVVGERGVKLSGGQRQRVAIARAILRDPQVLVLDEATSALDSESESLVQEALERLQRGRTTLVIAHRLSTIRDADRIVVLDHGQVVEVGRHEDLLARGGAYAQLVARQARAGQAEVEDVRAT